MKVNISFELDLTDTNFNIADDKKLPFVLEDLGIWLNDLHISHLRDATKSFTMLNEEQRNRMIAFYESKIALSKQLFNNYRVTGIMENGSSFEFTHQEPAYKEKLTIDGKESINEN